MSGRWLGLPGAALALALLTGAVVPAEPLLDATKQGDVEAVRSLLDGGADPNVAQGDGLTALHIAAQEGQLEIVKLLLGAGAKVEPPTRIGDYTPLHLAGRSGQVEVVSVLLEAGANPAVVATTTGTTPLHLAAKALDGESAVRLLLEHGAPVNAQETTAGQTPLMFAASYGRSASVRELLSHGADPEIRTKVVDVLRRMVVDREAQERLQEALVEIRRSSAEGTDRALGPSDVQAAIIVQREFIRSDDEMEELLKDFTPDDLAQVAPSWTTPSGYQSDIKIIRRPLMETLVGMTGGMTALLHAAREGHIVAAETLLDGGAEIDQVSADGSTPLVTALSNGQFDLAKMLIRRGADPNLATKTDGVSPLFAVLQTQWTFRFTEHPQPRAQDTQQTEYMELLKALLEAGADPNVPLKTHLWFSQYFDQILGLDLTGATPFWRAAIAQDVEAMKALAAYGADANIPTRLPEPGMRFTRRVNDGRQQDDSGLGLLPEGSPNMYPIHSAAGGGYMGLGAFQQNSVPNNFLNAVKYLIEELSVDVNLPDGWGYTPLHYASVRGGNDLIEYLMSKGADVRAISRLGQSVVDMARGGRAGYFSRTPYPETVELLLKLGSEFKCLHTHFRGTGDYCPGAGVELFEYMSEPEAGASSTDQRR